MFTQCSKCETVFRLSADALRAAGGQVRCGRCGEVFNALSRLAEEAGGFTTGESSLFLETRADEILEASASDLSHPPVDIGTPEAIDPPPGVEVAQLQFIGPVDDELADETSLEFTLPPGELDRIFIETPPTALLQLTADAQRAEPADHPTDHTTPPRPISSPDPSAEPAAHTQAQAPQEQERTATIVQLPQTRAQSPGPAPLAPPSRIAGLEVSDDVRQEMLSSLRAHAPRAAPSQSPPQSGAKPQRTSMPFRAWLSAAILLGVVLVIQVVRGSGWIAVHVPLLAGSGSTAASLSVYQLRQWGVTGDPGAKGTLRVRASIMNTAQQLKPYPLLRVSLVNRFGTRVGAREFEPAEYMGHGVARQLAPGERVDATLDILDPGKDAEGFEIDVCLRDVDGKIHCAGDARAQAG